MWNLNISPLCNSIMEYCIPKSLSFLLCCVSNCVADKCNGVVKGLHIVGGIVRLGKNNRSFNLIHTGRNTFSKYSCGMYVLLVLSFQFSKVEVWFWREYAIIDHIYGPNSSYWSSYCAGETFLTIWCLPIFLKFVVNCIVSRSECWSPTCVSSHKMTSHTPHQLSFILFPDISLLLCDVALWICIDVGSVFLWIISTHLPYFIVWHTRRHHLKAL